MTKFQNDAFCFASVLKHCVKAKTKQESKDSLINCSHNQANELGIA